MARRPTLRWIEPGQPLPDPALAMTEPNGLLAAGRDLSGARLLQAYRRGIFPWYSEGEPVLWWSPDPRMVLVLERFKTHRSLTKTLRRVSQPGGWKVSMDRSFRTVMRQCAAPRDGQAGTWITEDIIDAYCELHERGNAHSVEIHDENDDLIGGLYGVSIGRMFFGESMFALRTDASKIALWSWVHQLRTLGFRVIDCQQSSRHLASLGAAEVPRAQFLAQVAGLIELPSPDWSAVTLAFPPV